MPRISVKKDLIYSELGIKYTDDEFNDMLFDFGLEIDETEENNFIIEIPANRYDLCSVNGLLRSLKSYLEIEEYKELELINSEHKVFVENQPRYVACGIIEGIDFNQDIYEDFINYQEILHKTFCRNRSLAAIGTHDLDKIKFPVYFKSSHKNDFKFQILNNDKCMDGNEIEEHFKDDKKFSKYFKYLEEKPALFFDENNNILSYPPIINSNHSKISLQTKNIFVEVTGHNEKRVNESLYLILDSFRGTKTYKVEVNNIYTPVLRHKEMTITKEEVLKEIGIKMDGKEIEKHLRKMMYKIKDDVHNDIKNLEISSVGDTKENYNNQEIAFSIPEVRFDIMHKCDVIEDICVSYGFNNFNRSPPMFFTPGKELKINKICKKIRQEIANCGFLEALTLSLISNDENKLTGEDYVKVSNYQSLENESIKSSLLLTLLKTLSANQHFPAPIKIFEIGDIVLLDSQFDVLARNERRLSGLIASNTGGLEEIQGLITFLFKKLKNKVKFEEKNLKMYLSKRCGDIIVDDTKVGEFGIVCPKIIRFYNIPYVVSAFEINLEKVIQ
ncbi:Phenylalanyl-tRNA synthetase [Spraguea lophii 42_110]|uniref:phenylalanine--tRNA ligase n=1 Tax=Spraguea lophii (strain 42_110) TaxID=1358809 RepID=S7XUQ4_SPRLO|nr:Phenylalanyl-tRNA synthetase [Spraguea lophii 42_110]